jgi:hypothetical protein
MVFEGGRYTVHIGEPGTDKTRILSGLEIAAGDSIRVDFERR